MVFDGLTVAAGPGLQLVRPRSRKRRLPHADHIAEQVPSYDMGSFCPALC